MSGAKREKLPDDPKFSLTWISGPGHSYQSGFFRTDDLFAQFLSRNRKALDESYLFFMGDHGFRIGHDGILGTKIGLLEMSNPYLAISVPKGLRNSGILKNMVENSKKLQTHFDTRATILDILEPRAGHEKGDSYFQKQPNVERTCGSLPIPNRYCICDRKTVKVESGELGLKIGRLVTEQINQFLVSSNFSKVCIKMELDMVKSLQKHMNDEETIVGEYLIDVLMTEPSKALYQAIAYHDPTTGNVKLGDTTRMNTYGSTANCIYDELVRPFCYCDPETFEPNRKS